jgi:ABC-type nitrate/sulfonate/bicarbonate transport system substrate-binding protein
MTLRIMPHGRLQEWVADEKGYFKEEGLDYVFVYDLTGAHRERDESGQVRSGAYETYEAGRDADISCACHWAVNTAATNQFGRLVSTAYSVTPCGVMVPPSSTVRHPSDLAGVEIGVGYHSGSHFATVQALEPFLAEDQLRLRFEGMPNDRLDAVITGKVAAATLFGVQLYVAEALGCRKIVDATFMIGFLAGGLDGDAEEVRRYFNGLKKAQMEIDLHPERYKHYHLKAVPEQYREAVDVRTFGPGERIVFLPYTGESYQSTQEWIKDHRIFGDRMDVPAYGDVVLA